MNADGGGRARPAKTKNVRLNILRTYAVHWDAPTLVRDVLQNFFDATEDFEGVTFAIDRKTGLVRLEGPKRFELDYVKYIGGTTKAGGRFAGQFGEGFKVSALVAMRDFGLRLRAGSGTWRIEPTFSKVRVGEELVYQLSTDSDLAGSFLELHGCSPELMDLFAEGRRFFRWSGNPSFGECLFSDGDAFVYRTTRGEGEVYYGKQLRAELWRVPFAFCLDGTLKNIRRDRDRRTLARNQIRIVLSEIGGRMPFDVGLQIIKELEHHWANERNDLHWFIHGLHHKHAPTYGESWPSSFPEKWVASETTLRWRHANAHARRIGLEVAAYTLGRIGMRSAREAWLSTVHLVDESELTDLQRARRDLLLEAGATLYDGTKPQVHFARMSSHEGEHRGADIVLELALLEGTFADALSTYLHELCHEHGRDGDARFSDALTDALRNAIEAHPRIAAFEAAWQALERPPPP